MAHLAVNGPGSSGLTDFLTLGILMRYLIITKKQLMLGICVVLALTIVIIGSTTIFATNDRKLPIYCVETDKKQIAISFDAAWGNSKKVQRFRLL